MDYLELTGTIVGLIYLWLEYKASIYLWAASIVMPAIYIFVYYKAGLYADFGINIYFLLASIYGWIAWKYGRNGQKKNVNDNSRGIRRIDCQTLAGAAAVFVICFAAIAIILREFTDSNVPYLDSFTTALSIIALWMLSRKYLEQWLAWILVDVVSAGLYIYKELYLTAGLYALYSAIAFMGYLNWKKLMKS